MGSGLQENDLKDTDKSVEESQNVFAELWAHANSAAGQVQPVAQGAASLTQNWTKKDTLFLRWNPLLWQRQI